MIYSGSNRSQRCRLRHRARVMAAVIMAFLFAPWSTAAKAQELVVADGLAVYFGVIPAEIVAGHKKTHPEAEMHGGPPASEHAYHLMVAIFDQATGQRITDAQVSARLSPLGLVGAMKSLDRMSVGDAVTYGNYFDLPGRGPYRFDVEILRSGATKPVRVRFALEHLNR